ncbi:MarR family winged helix-turn-helix transcriptional regulator [Microlunatus capsulatus]|uniref:DNA-binding MarR family transcriptional regulator n=1 Tax=Microlunatus capsulatus TaxID=99117 RepID=A0ABS4Z302_9ACTN|nr:MarR family transcriptional regulator [Microlunatus capsulatus]MBP2415371.1 DNA-binding MarR family transcriptional regulator [Microlunatus capsulatus]
MSADPEPAPRRAEEIDWEAGGIETELGWSLQAFYQAFTRTATPAVAEVPGGPRGYQVLVAVTTEDPTSQLLLAQRLGVDKTAMTYLVDALEAEGLVERRAHPRDRRVRQVLPTAPGRARLESARTALRAVEDLLMRDLDVDERTRLRHLMARVALGAGDTPAQPDHPQPDQPQPDQPQPDHPQPDQPLAAPHRSARRRPTPSPES